MPKKAVKKSTKSTSLKKSPGSKKKIQRVLKKAAVKPKTAVKPLQRKPFPKDDDPIARKHGEGRLYPDEDDEQGSLPPKSPLQRLEAVEKGDADEDLDTDIGREKQVEEDEVEPWEAGFAEGASDEGIHGKDALTGQPLMDVENVVETEIEGKNYRFVNEKNAEKFLERIKKRKK